MIMTEVQLQDATFELGGVLGWLCYHTFDARHSRPGFPDGVMVRAPRLLIVEFKGAKGRVSPAQAEWASQLERVAAAIAEGFTVEWVADVPLFAYRLWTPDHWTSGAVERELRARP